MKKHLLEIACFDEESAVKAAKGGADRIELCRDCVSGGLSADATVLASLKSRIPIPIFVMIRPHARNFYYSEEEFEEMKATLINLKSLGADGFVFGILQQSNQDQSNEIDIKRNSQLVQLAEGRSCTFHRAFDLIPESKWNVSLSGLAECGFRSILTCGGCSENKAEDNIGALSRLFHCKTSHGPNLEGREIDIIIGGGVRSTNVLILWENTHCQIFHSSAILSDDNVVSMEEVAETREALDGFPLAEQIKSL
ncbi:hypothetical protein PENSTE_c004G02620 [Penicillium steckii]|uniref:Copper homeostasis protein cutC homolog n=1 Tax=Penicillium steckii TaxID=303698 RepID=A0A1V6TP39_9EURO|nr:hypothetical protein PENSTE_c004G02620 [Penicillium steckii]